ncbi:MAG: PHP domain-containing protein [Paludibacter sp.]|jgi:hypothetical protein|nr:PHP domain-containing protein [Paludibacter sp.]
MKVNAHLHTPYSFSAFKNIDEALDKALNENVKVVGINDFYTTAGYSAWADGCTKRGLYPLFGIEFISLNRADQQAGLRVNDPGNPGRTYLSGKAMSHPFTISEPYTSLLATVVEQSNAQVEAMLIKLNQILKDKNAGFSLALEQIKQKFTMGMLRERHLAKALRVAAYENLQNNADSIKAFFKNIFDGKELKSQIEDIAGVENEIRSNLLKAGGAAFVPETPEAFLPMETVREIIIACGGIPTYPFLADDAKGEYTDFERDLERVAQQITERGFHSVEFITTRNDVKLLEKYASFLYDYGFVVTFGSEHNTPAMEPIELFARHNTPLSEKLLEINFKGACVLAAHQDLVRQGLSGYVDKAGNADRNRRSEFEKMGAELLGNVECRK